MAEESAPRDTARTNRAIVRGWLRRALPWVLLAIAAWLAFSDFEGRSTVETGTAAPGLVAELADGGSFELSAHRGEVVVLNFWATWCPPCRAEAPVLTRVHNRLRRSGGTVIGISADRAELSRVAVAALDLGMEYPIARSDEDTFARYRVTELPTTYVVSPTGEIVWSHVGAVDEARLEAAIGEHL